MSHRVKQGKLKAATKAARRRANAAPEIPGGAHAEAVLQERIDTFSNVEKATLEETGRRVLLDTETEFDNGVLVYGGAKKIPSENASLDDYMLIGFVAEVMGKRRRGHVSLASSGKRGPDPIVARPHDRRHFRPLQPNQPMRPDALARH